MAEHHAHNVKVAGSNSAVSTYLRYALDGTVRFNGMKKPNGIVDIYMGVYQSGRLLALDARGRWFKSNHPYNIILAQNPIGKGTVCKTALLSSILNWAFIRVIAVAQL